MSLLIILIIMLVFAVQCLVIVIRTYRQDKKIPIRLVVFCLVMEVLAGAGVHTNFETEVVPVASVTVSGDGYSVVTESGTRIDTKQSKQSTYQDYMLSVEKYKWLYGQATVGECTLLLPSRILK